MAPVDISFALTQNGKSAQSCGNMSNICALRFGKRVF
jgi:hypothetical protein